MKRSILTSSSYRLFLFVFLLISNFCSYAQQVSTMTGSYTNGNYYNYSNAGITITNSNITPAVNQSVNIYILTADCAPITLNASTGQNFVATFVPRISGLTSLTQLIGRSTCDLMQTVQYLDGLGRPMQTVDVNASPTLRDLVSPIVYDAFGRDATKYLPYASTSANDGSYKPNALGDQGNFYNSPPSGVSVITTPFAVAGFEPSPLNRTIEQGAPGVAWQLPGSGSSTSTGHTQKADFGSNDQSTAFNSSPSASNLGSRIVALYTVTINSDQSRTLLRSGNNATYAPGQLGLSITKDENWNAATDGCTGTTETYTDNLSHVVLKRTYNNNAGILEMLSTYYVYDDMGNLAFVLPPMANGDANAAISQPTLDNLCYQYRYDQRNRIVQKKIPGKGWEFMVYNAIDQVVMTQDANQRNQSPQQWTFTKYDAKGRVIVNGQYPYPGSSADGSTAPALTELLYLQNYSNTQTVLWETTTSSGIGYTNNAIPQGTVAYLSINYYDNYTSIPGLPAAYSTAPTGASTSTTDLLTATQVNVLGTTNMLWAVHYYDALGRIIQSYQQHYLGGVANVNNYDVTTIGVNGYNFNDQVISSTRAHYKLSGSSAVLAATIATAYTYDHMGRKKQTTEAIASGSSALPSPVVLSQIDYNEVGQLLTKHLHSTTGAAPFLQDVNYTYNERGWTTGSSAPLFAMQLNYNKGTTPQYNGNIANQYWGTPENLGKSYTYSYDALNRLTSGISSNNYNESGIAYDLAGNIKTLQRTYGSSTVIDNLTYNYGGTNQVQSVNDAATDGSVMGYKAGTYSYVYDLNGNILTDNSKGLGTSYNLLNLPNVNTLSTGTVTYTYDASGRKLRKVNAIGTPVATDYIDGIQYDSGTITFIQTEEGRAVNSGGTYNYEYNLSDHLGNSRLTFDTHTGATSTTQQDDYMPFGMNISIGSIVSPANNYLYNKKELQREVGLYDYGARFYDPVIARWTSVDRYAEKYHDMSPYGYVANNPIKSIDANGDTIIKVNIVDRSGYVHGASSVYIDQSFYGDLKNILAEAGAGTNIYINSSFRTDAKQAELQGDADATTPAPVGNSPHNAGVALDFNLYKDNDVSKGTIGKNKTVTDANEFIKDVKKVKGTRWGGDFKKKDPVHIDKRPGKAEFNKLRDEDQDQMHGDSETKNNDAYIKTTVTLYVLPPDKKKDDKQQ